MPILKKDKFISLILKYDAYSFSYKSNNNKLVLPKKNKIFIYSNISTKNLKGIKLLENNNFNLITTNLSFIYNKKLKQNNRKIIYRFATKKDESVVVKIAYNSFRDSRFSIDDNFNSKIGKIIKKRWVENYFLGKRGTHMIVAEKNNKIVGFLLLIKKKSNILIDLIAVDKKYRKIGIGESLIKSIGKFNDLKYKSISVGTQITNKASIHLYNKIGFKLDKTFYNFHLHIK